MNETSIPANIVDDQSISFDQVDVKLFPSMLMNDAPMGLSPPCHLVYVKKRSLSCQTLSRADQELIQSTLLKDLEIASILI